MTCLRSSSRPWVKSLSLFFNVLPKDNVLPFFLWKASDRPNRKCSLPATDAFTEAGCHPPALPINMLGMRPTPHSVVNPSQLSLASTRAHPCSGQEVNSQPQPHQLAPGLFLSLPSSKARLRCPREARPQLRGSHGQDLERGDG